jgi:hypothetical protein
MILKPQASKIVQKRPLRQTKTHGEQTDCEFLPSSRVKAGNFIAPEGNETWVRVEPT